MLYTAIVVFAVAPFGILGVLLTASTLISIIVVHFVGKLIDRQQQKKLIVSNLPIEMGLAICRLFIQSPTTVVAHDILHKQTATNLTTLEVRNFYHWSEYFTAIEKLNFLIVTKIMFQCPCFNILWSYLSNFKPSNSQRRSFALLHYYPCVAVSSPNFLDDETKITSSVTKKSMVTRTPKSGLNLYKNLF